MALDGEAFIRKLKGMNCTLDELRFMYNAIADEIHRSPDPLKISRGVPAVRSLMRYFEDVREKHHGFTHEEDEDMAFFDGEY